jgi:hypothetical protein
MICAEAGMTTTTVIAIANKSRTVRDGMTASSGY